VEDVFVRKLPAFALAAVAAAELAGAAYAAAPKTAAPQTHVMNVPLPDGSVAKVEYVGDVAPKVTVAPRPLADAAMPWAMPFPSMAGFDRIIEQMNRQTQEMVRRAQDIARQPAGAQPYIAAYGDLPAGESSTTVVSVTNGGKTCTRTTQVVSQGPGKPPKVTSQANGQCDGAASAPSGPTHPA
jgi:hypothetical protein